MASSSVVVIISLLLLSLFLSVSSAAPSGNILNAAAILSNSGYASMALTLELASQTLVLQSSSLTVFAPSDSAFGHSGQPTFSLLQCHLLPLAFSFESLKSLPTGAKISTLLSAHSLIVTTSPSDDHVSLNNVTVNGSPIYDDGSLIIFGIDNFFDPYYQFPRPIQRISGNLACAASSKMDDMTGGFSGSSHSFDEACEKMRSTGFTVMASFLDMQFLGVQNKTTLTVFAPADEVMVNLLGDLSLTDFSSSIFHRYVVPCRLLWSDLVKMDDGTVLRTYSEGFTLNITRFSGVLVLNDVPVVYPDLYFSDWLVVHGVRDILVAPKQTEEVPESPADRVPKQIEQAPQSSPEMPMQTDIVVDYSNQMPFQAEEGEEYYSDEVPMQTDQQVESSSDLGRFEENDVGHYRFSVFN